MSVGIKHVAFGRPAQSAAWFVLYEDGSQAWSGFPTSLHNKLNGRKKSLPGVEYLAMSDSRSCSWFVRFEDKTYRWETENEKLDRWLREDTVSKVVFGPGDGYFVIFEDGSTAWDGLPRSLHNKLIGRQKSLPAVKSLAISSSGGWFVIFEDGQFSWMGLPKYLNDALRQNVEVKFLTLSPDDNQSYFVEFEDGFQEWSYTEEFAREIKIDSSAAGGGDRDGGGRGEGAVDGGVGASSDEEDGPVGVGGAGGGDSRWSPAPQTQPPSLRKPKPMMMIGVRGTMDGIGGGGGGCDSPMGAIRSPLTLHSRPLMNFRSTSMGHVAAAHLPPPSPAGMLAGPPAGVPSSLMMSAKDLASPTPATSSMMTPPGAAASIPPGVAAGAAEGDGCEEERELEIDPRDIRYTQEVISSRFRNGRSLYDAVRDLQYGYLTPNDFPPIRVVTSRKELFAARPLEVVIVPDPFTSADR
ncbi:hypothetical protein CBR_g3517 [Chara braunii]|uniref:Uncharacterized protein n=1 Tax=Chara braunii TaxID=69332 RepID=A0A388KFS5_CHABU|nr:hypothetical protein CBR_g3517 [Chara braunii]|eukprot:GBG68823.1 hypothetical protein CBR_g3517 [Chara braunii]